MKIFNWVHRKFHHNADYLLISQKKDGYAQNVKKFETVTNDEAYTEALLLDKINLVDVLDGWKDGILTIGTFGFDPLKTQLNQQNNNYSLIEEKEKEEDYSSVTDDEEGENVEDAEGELHPLVVKAFKRQIGKSLGSEPITGDAGKPDFLTSVDDIPLLRFLESPELKNNSEESKKKKEGRITLADLFSADPEVTGKSESGVLKPNSSKKPELLTETQGRSFAKSKQKLVPRKGEDSRPIRKLHRLITKMLKKKIHPELDGKIHGMDGQIDASKMDKSVLGEGGLSQDLNGHGATESISLLQDAVVGL